jgi:ribose transport system ATP-binding protein
MGRDSTDPSGRRAVSVSVPVLRMRGINKSFDRVRVLDDVDFELRPAEVHALLGGNGAGKSTLMKILQGVHQPDSGTIEMGGESVRLSSPQDAQRHGIAMIFQEFSLVSSLSVAANICLGAEPGRGGFIDHAAARRRAREQLRDVNLNLDPNTEVSRLSTAYWQLVEIAKAISQNASILIMDEPTASLASSEVERLFDLIEDLKARGISIVYISHRLEEISRVADRVTILRDGRVVVTENANELAMEQLIEHIVGREVGDELQAREDDGSSTPSRGAPLLEVEGLAAGDRVKSVSFDVHAGEIVGIVGLMGSGRSELARALCGIDRISGGQVRLRGRALTVRRPADAIAAGVVLVPEDRRLQGLILDHSVQSNLLIPLLGRLTHRGLISARRCREVYDRYAKRLSIKTPSPDSLAKRLSGGNQQKVVIAKWLACEPDLLILDEPTAGVDVGARSEIVGMVRELADGGKGVILISSELNEVLALADKVLVLRGGRVTACVPRASVGSEAELHHLVQVG